MKVKLSLNEKLPLHKMIEIHSMIIVARVVFIKITNNPQVLLHECLYKL